MRVTASKGFRNSILPQTLARSLRVRAGGRVPALVPLAAATLTTTTWAHKLGQTMTAGWGQRLLQQQLSLWQPARL